jgi:polyribonucleotide nucleotidyltransferase
VEDDGQVSITGTDPRGIERATEWIKTLTREIVSGEEFSGRVTRLMNFGAFVELIPGTEGLVHISEFGPGFVRRIEDVAAVGDMLPVVVKEIDTLGRINLSLKGSRRAPAGAAEHPAADAERGEFDRPRRFGGRGSPRRPPSSRRSGPPQRRPGYFRR